MDNVFDLSELDDIDEGRFVAHITDKVRWVWVYAGPGHQKTVEMSKRRSQKRLKEDALKEQAITNGKKWKAEEKTPDDVREDMISIAVERLLRWHFEDIGTGAIVDVPVVLNGETLSFSEDSARKILRDPRRGSLLVKALEWLGDERSFLKPAPTTSGTSPNARSSSEETKREEPAETAWNQG